ncbi:MAG: hypothetical protein NTZ05_11895, partial [Chloroflexi bacterium]|nr:hypothetical protein [Chloroflexota bacterium]
DYDQLYAYADLPSLSGFLSLGVVGIAASRLSALAGNALDFFGGVYYLTPLTALGLWQVRRRREWRPFLIYTVLLYFTMSLVFAFPGMRGSFRHSAAALVPWLAVASVVGLRTAVLWAAKRLPHWEPERAVLGFGMVLVTGAALLSVITLSGHLTTWQTAYDNYVELAAWLRRQEPGDTPVMVTNPPLFNYVTHRSAIVTPSDGIPALLAA